MTCSATAAAIADRTLDATHLQRSQLLASVPGVVHGITRRVVGVGLADGNVGYSAPRDREDAWSMRRQWLAAAGLEAAQIVVGSQVHGRGVMVIRAEDAGHGAAPESRPVGVADGLVSSERGVVLMTLHADCMPIMLCDPIQRVVATIHAGWRGTVADVAGATIQTMHDQFGSEPADILAYLGPAIGACCYVVGHDVFGAWGECAGDTAPGAIMAAGDRWTFDLATANRLLLLRAGLRSEQIEESSICTRCGGDEWFSHRGQGPATGRYGAFIALTES